MSQAIQPTSGLEQTRIDAEHQEQIDACVERTQWSVKAVDVATGLVGLAAAIVAYLLLVTLVDHWVVGLSTGMRLAALVTLLLGVAAFLGVWFVPIVVRQVNPLYAARVIEQSTPSLKNSLLNLLLLSRRPDSVRPMIFSGLRRQAAEQVATLPQGSPVDHGPLIVAGYWLAGLVALAATYKLLSPKDPLQSAARVVAPWEAIERPGRVRIEAVRPGDASVYRGQTMEVEALLQGLRDGDSAEVVLSVPGGRPPRVVALKADDRDSRRYFAQLRFDEQDLPGELEYHVRAGDARSRDFLLKLVDAPRISVESVTYEYPAYTGLAARQDSQSGDLVALEGTKVRIVARANQPIQDAYLELFATATAADGENGAGDAGAVAKGDRGDATRPVQALPMKVSAGRTPPDEAHGRLTLLLDKHRESSPFMSYQLRFKNDRGDLSPHSVRHRIQVTRDLSPVVEILSPVDREVRVPLYGRLQFEVRALDPDFGLSAVRLKGELAGTVRWDESLLAKPPHSGQFVRKVTLVPARLGLKPGQELRVWAEADDNRQSVAGTTEPNSTRTEVYRVLITEPAAKSGTGNDGSGQGDSEQGGSEQGGSEQGGSEQGGSEQGGSEQGGSEQGGQGSGSESESVGGGDSGESQGKEGGASGGQSGSAEGDEQNSEPDASSEESDPLPSDGSRDGDAFERILKRMREQSKGAREPQGQSEGSVPSEADADDTATSTGSQPRDTARGTGKPTASQERSTDGGPAGQSPADDSQDMDSGDGEANPSDSEDGESGGARSSEKRGAPGTGQSATRPRTTGAESNQTESSDATESASEGASENGTGSGEESGSEQGAGESSGESGDRDLPGNSSQKGPKGSGKNSPAGRSGSSSGEEGNEAAGDSDGAGSDGSRADAGRDAEAGSQTSASDAAGSETEGDETAGEDSGAQSSSKGASERNSTSGSSGSTPRAGDSAGEDAQGSEDPSDPSSESSGDNALNPEAGEGASGEDGASGSSAASRSTTPKAESDGSRPSSAAGTENEAGGSSQDSSTQDDDSRTVGREDAGSDAASGAAGPSRGGGQGGKSGAAEAEAAEATADAANLEYANKATAMALDYLRNQPPDRELLERLGWTPEEMKAFVDRWRRMRSASGPDQERGSQAADRLSDQLRGLGLRPPRTQVRADRPAKDAGGSLRQGGSASVLPPEYQEQYRAFLKSMPEPSRGAASDRAGGP